MSRTTRLLAPLALAAALLAAPGAHAQPARAGANPQPVAIPGGGTELLRAFLDRKGIRPVTANELRNGFATDDLIVVVIGSTNGWEWGLDPLTWARRAVAANGAALIASDSWGVQLRDSFWNQQAGSINGADVTAAWADCHDGHAECPYAVPVSPDEVLKAGEKPGRVWSLFRGLNRVATNQPTYIDMTRYQNEYQYPLARLPKSSRTQWGGRFNPQPLLAVGGDGPEQPWNPGRGYSFLAVADPSIFINQMIMERDANNLAFALRTVEYLRGPDGHRKRCAFFENGRVVESFDELKQSLARQKAKIPPEAVPNMGPLFGKNQEKITELVDKMADQIQTKDGLHNWKMGKEGSPEEQRNFAKWVEGAAAALAVCASIFLLGRTMRARHPTNLPPPPATGAGAASTGPPGVFDRRQKELVRRNNLYEPVRNLLREFFESAGGPANPGPRLPRLVIDHRRVRKPDSLRQALRDMWRLAYGPPAYVSAQRWFELEPYFERLRQAHADGKWRFESAEEE